MSADVQSRAAGLHLYLAECRALALEEIRRVMPADAKLGPILYDLVLDYPLRDAKGLRPSLCLATCRALGGSEAGALPTAAALELYPNAFLVHDDVEDGSLLRRDAPTLHRQHGTPIAINVGDTMLALAMIPLVENTKAIGLGKSLRVFQVIAQMARETAEGQALELDWIRRNEWEVTNDDYREMVVKKTGWYSFIAPVTLGAIVGGATASQLATLEEFARELAIAFQIRDDTLNLGFANGDYGKEQNGDLWEGKRTLVLLHSLRVSSPEQRARARHILSLPRAAHPDRHLDGSLFADLVRSGDLTLRGRDVLAQRVATEVAGAKTEEDVHWLFQLVTENESIRYADDIGRVHARRAAELLDDAAEWLPHSSHRDLLTALVEFTVARDR